MLKKLQERIFPTIIALTALSVSLSAAFYSVTGLSKLFAGATLEVIIMAGSLEVAKLVIASLLYQYWERLNKILRVYLATATVILVLITSMGIYGFLSNAYIQTATKSEITDKQIAVIQLKKERFEEDRITYTSEKEKLNENITELRNSLSKGTIVQYVDKETGQVITTTSSSARRSLEKQLNIALSSRNEISKKLESVTDSVTTLELKILDIESSSDLASELGPLKYLSKLTGESMDQIVNWLLLIIIFVFDPLAIALVIAANFAFSNLSKKKEFKDKIKEKKIIIKKTSPLISKKETIKIPTEGEIESASKQMEKVMEEEDEELKRKKEMERKELEEGSIPGVKGTYAIKEPKKNEGDPIKGKHSRVSKEEWLKAAKKKNNGNKEKS